MVSVTLHLLNTGFCTVSEHQILAGGRHTELRLPSVVALIHHPQSGWILYDTGYAPRVWEASEGWPYSLYRQAAPFTAPPELAVAAQLPPFGLTPRDIQYVLVSHFHPDHIGGLKDFPEARLVATQTGYSDIRWRGHLWAMSRAFLPRLLPVDFAERTLLLTAADFTYSEPKFISSYDLFGDGSLRLLPLPGHAVGQIGLRAETDHGPVFLVSDAAYLRRSIYENRPPHPVTALFSESRSTTLRTLHALRNFALSHPDITLIPAHCPDAFADWNAAALPPATV